MTSAGAAAGEGPLAIICGAGSLPYAVADAVQARSRRVLMFPLNGWADPAAVARYPHQWIALGQFGRFCRLMNAQNCRDVVWIGGLVRPALTQIRLDLATLRALPRIVRAFRGGDDHLLTGIAAIFADAGIRLLAVQEVAPELLAPPGALGRHSPDARARADIDRALALLTTIGRFDIGQAAVVADGHVLAVEAAEGTDLMLARIAELRRIGRVRSPVATGVLIKAPKPTQDRRFDLPTIGPATVAAVADAGLAGVAVCAGATLIAEATATVMAADRAGIFIHGFTEDAPGAR